MLCKVLAGEDLGTSNKPLNVMAPHPSLLPVHFVWMARHSLPHP